MTVISQEGDREIYSDYYLYKGKVCHVSQCLSEAELYGVEDTCICNGLHQGESMLFLDELGIYVQGNECTVVAPTPLIRLKFFLFQQVFVKWRKLVDSLSPDLDDIPF